MKIGVVFSWTSEIYCYYVYLDTLISQININKKKKIETFLRSASYFVV